MYVTQSFLYKNDDIVNICGYVLAGYKQKDITAKILKNSDTWKIAVIILKLEQYHFTTE